jgi:hypothetical protein
MVRRTLGEKPDENLRKLQEILAKSAKPGSAVIGEAAHGQPGPDKISVKTPWSLRGNARGNDGAVDAPVGS